MDQRKIKRRAVIVAVIFLLLAALSAASLVKLQVAHGEEYREESENSIYSYEEIPAVRGQIYDRYGVLLVGNVIIYNVRLSTDFVAEDDLANATLLTLTGLADRAAVPYADNLPINADGTEYIDPDGPWQQYWEMYVKARKWDSDISAADAMEKMARRYGLSDEYTPQQARKILGIRYELELRKVVNLDSYVFAENVDVSFISMIREHNLQNVIVEQSGQRVITTDYAAHLLGTTGDMTSDSEVEYYTSLGYDLSEKVGKFGIEQAMEEVLHGWPGQKMVISNTQGAQTGEEVIEPARQGSSIYLTIDIGMQEVAEQSLKTTIETLRQSADASYGGNAEGGAVVVMDVKNSEILASASYPTYDLDRYFSDYGQLLEAQNNPLYNRAAMGQYEPGSTFKMVTAAAALETGIVGVATEIEDYGVYRYYESAGYSPKCWVYTSRGGTHGIVNVSQALGFSCNYYFYETGRLTGIKKIDEYAAKFGLGLPTGVEISENTGFTAGPDTLSEWYESLTIQAAIGQQSTYTPLQLANYVATIANGGTRYQAHFVRAVADGDTGQVLESDFTAVAEETGISPATIKAIQEGMLHCTTEGTASAYLGDYPVAIASKTGSAQIGGDSDNAMFVCYAPYDDPEIAMAIVVEKGGKGSLVTDIARDIFDYYFQNSDRTTSDPVNSLIK
ncbi:MAG: hypothetical protein IJP23_06140 [Oscillospiraceae bacterium]|nr:hypothetical protein [Oscillospiraceae bacterium]